MSVTEVRHVPADGQEHEPIQHEYEKPSAGKEVDVHEQPPLTHQIEETVVKFSIAEDFSTILTNQAVVANTYFHEISRPFENVVDESSSSSSESSGSSMDSEASAEVPVFNPSTEHKPERWSADNEVVSGHEHHNYKNERPCGGNLPVVQTYPQQQTRPPVDLYGAGEAMVTANDEWPMQQCPEHHNFGVMKMETGGLVSQDSQVAYSMGLPMASQPVQSISAAEALTVPENPQQVDRREERSRMVIGGLSHTSTEHVDASLLTPDVIKNERNYMEDCVFAFGKALHPLVDAVHRDPTNDVRFESKEKSRKRKRSGEINVCSTDSMQSVDTSDGRRLLKHVYKHFGHYDSLLSLRGTFQIKELIRFIRGRIPQRLSHSLTWNCVFDTASHMRMFIERIVDGLKSSDRPSLAESVLMGINDLNNVTESADRARRLSRQMSD